MIHKKYDRTSESIPFTPLNVRKREEAHQAQYPILLYSQQRSASSLHPEYSAHIVQDFVLLPAGATARLPSRILGRFWLVLFVPSDVGAIHIDGEGECDGDSAKYWVRDSVR